MMLVERLWEKLDTGYVELLNELKYVGDSNREADLSKGRLRGLAEATAIFMSPHFKSGDDIVREVVRRWETRHVLREEPTTPGIGSRRLEMPSYEPSADHKETATKRASVQELASRSVPASHSSVKRKTEVFPAVDPATRDAIKELKSSGKEMVAMIYGLSEAHVESIWS